MRVTATKTLDLYSAKAGKIIKVNVELNGDTDKMIQALVRRAMDNKSKKATALEGGVSVEIIIEDGKFVYPEC